MSERRTRVSRRAALVGLGLGASATAGWLIFGDSQLWFGAMTVSMAVTKPTYALLTSGDGYLLSLSGLRADVAHGGPASGDVSMVTEPSQSAALETVQGHRANGVAEHLGPWGAVQGAGGMPFSVAYRFPQSTFIAPGSLRRLKWQVNAELRRGAGRKKFSITINAALLPDRDIHGNARSTGTWART